MKDSKLLIIKDFTIPFTSGSGINVFYFAKEVSNFNFKVTILTFNWELVHKTIEKHEDLTIIRMPYSSKLVYKPLFCIIALITQFIQILWYKNILLNGIFPGYLWVITIGRILNRNIIFESTTLKVDDFKSLILRKNYGACVRKIILSKISGYHSINPVFTKIFFEAISNSKIRYLESTQGVDTKRFKPVTNLQKKELRKKLNLPIDKTIIISIGNLTKRKGYQNSFKVLSNFESEFIYCVIGRYRLDAEYYFWQSATEMNDLFCMGKKLLKDRVLFIGSKWNVEEYLQAADIYLLNSEYEGLPISLMEAMACGIPCILKALPGVEDFIAFNNKNALIINTDQMLKEKLEILIKNSEIRLKIGCSGAESVFNNHSYLKLIPDFMDVFLK